VWLVSTGDVLRTGQRVQAPCTLSLRFRCDAPAGFYGWLLGGDGPAPLLVGIQDWRAAGYRLRLLLNVAGREYPGPELTAGQWYHLVLTRGKEGRLHLYLDGKVVAADLSVPPGDYGDWLLGTRTGVPLLEQFYGAVDDVLLFHRVLKPAEVGRFTPARRWSFENGSSGESKAAANHRTVLTPPVVGDWRVIQGFHGEDHRGVGAGSHTGFAAYSVDLARLEGLTDGAPVVAAAGGTVVKVADGTPGPGGRSNEVVVRHAAHEFTSYLHLQPGVPVRVGDSVRRGERLGRVGNSGTQEPHLHFALLYGEPHGQNNSLDLTRPFVFDGQTPRFDDVLGR
jgi:murein DD-endopeptidase MepM/ murein hydrolase activator NlpD